MDIQKHITDGDTTGLFTFPDMRLRVGDRVQLQLPLVTGGDVGERHFVKVIGYLDNVSLLVNTPLLSGNRPSLRENDRLVVRVFSSQKAFAFDCSIRKVNSVPFSYLHLSYPEKIQGSVVRKEPRIRVRIIASVKKAGDVIPEEKFSIIINNLSATGALFLNSRPLFQKDQQVTVSFQIKLHHIDSLMVVSALVRSVTEVESSEVGADKKFSHGLQFVDMELNNTMLLQSLIYQQMIEHPQSVI